MVRASARIRNLVPGPRAVRVFNGRGTLTGKVVLVTGGARARRRGDLRAGCTRPARPWCCTTTRLERRGAALLQPSSTLRAPNSVALVQADLLDAAGLPELVENRRRRASGALDVLVNNASSFYPTPLGEISEARLGRSRRHQPEGAAVPRRRPRRRICGRARGCIVNIIDIHAERPLKNYVVYSVAKARAGRPHAVARARTRARRCA